MVQEPLPSTAAPNGLRYISLNSIKFGAIPGCFKLFWQGEFSLQEETHKLNIFENILQIF